MPGCKLRGLVRMLRPKEELPPRFQVQLVFAVTPVCSKDIANWKSVGPNDRSSVRSCPMNYHCFLLTVQGWFQVPALLKDRHVERK